MKTTQDFSFDGANLASKDFSGQLFVACSFVGANFEAAILKGTKFERCIFRQAKFDHCNMEEYTTFERCDLNQVSFIAANIENGSFKECHLADCSFSLSFLVGGKLDECKFQKCDFKNANLRLLQVIDTDFVGVNLQGANFDLATFHRCNFDNTAFEDKETASTNLSPEQFEQSYFIRFQGHSRLSKQFEKNVWDIKHDEERAARYILSHCRKEIQKLRAQSELRNLSEHELMVGQICTSVIQYVKADFNKRSQNTMLESKERWDSFDFQALSRAQGQPLYVSEEEDARARPNHLDPRYLPLIHHTAYPPFTIDLAVKTFKEYFAKPLRDNAGLTLASYFCNHFLPRATMDYNEDDSIYLIWFLACLRSFQEENDYSDKVENLIVINLFMLSRKNRFLEMLQRYLGIVANAYIEVEPTLPKGEKGTLLVQEKFKPVTTRLYRMFNGEKQQDRVLKKVGTVFGVLAIPFLLFPIIMLFDEPLMGLVGLVWMPPYYLQPTIFMNRKWKYDAVPQLLKTRFGLVNSFGLGAFIVGMFSFSFIYGLCLMGSCWLLDQIFHLGLLGK